MSQMRKEVLACKLFQDIENVGPALGIGTGCGFGFGVGLTGGYGAGPAHKPQLGIGFGAGCGVGVGIGYGFGRGAVFDHASAFRNVLKYLKFGAILILVKIIES
ncbi:hypothetical protein N665_0381s0036 [Sinapis alba]|nr:hypothetical protein N665_0381s0036 [Sinapis alba]